MYHFCNLQNSSYVLNCFNFNNSATFATVVSAQLCSRSETKFIVAFAVISSHCTSSRFILFLSALASSLMFYQFLFLPVALPALPVTVAFIQSSVSFNLY